MGRGVLFSDVNNLPARRGQKIDAAMDAEEFRRILHQLGLSYRTASKHLGVSFRTVAGYGIGEMPISAPVANLLRLWLQIKRSHGKVRLPFAAAD